MAGTGPGSVEGTTFSERSGWDYTVELMDYGFDSMADAILRRWQYNIEKAGVLSGFTLEANPGSVADLIGIDTDDFSLRGYDGTNQFVHGQKTKTLQFTIPQPDDLDEDDDIPIWSNETGFSFIITSIKAWADADDATFTLVETSATDYDSETTIEAITVFEGIEPT